MVDIAIVAQGQECAKPRLNVSTRERLPLNGVICYVFTAVKGLQCLKLKRGKI